MGNKEKNLLLKSTVCDNDNDLKKVLERFPKSIKYKHLLKIKQENKRVYQLLEQRNTILEMIHNSREEWGEGKATDKKRNEPCELCGNTRSQDKFIIPNGRNGNILYVGSECVHKFGKKIYGYNAHTISNYKKNNPEKYERISTFNRYFEGGKNIYNNWQTKYKELGIIFSNEYDKELSKIKNASKKIYNDYVNGKISIEEMKRFKIYMKEFNFFYNKCKEKLLNNRYICTQKIANSLDKNIIRNIKETGEIERYFAKYVPHIDFISRFKNEITSEFKKHNLEFFKIDREGVYFSYKYEDFNSITTRIALEKFSLKFSDIFYNRKNSETHQIFNVLRINNDYDSVNELLGIMQDILKKSKYKFVMSPQMYMTRTVELYKIGQKSFATLKLKEIFEMDLNILHVESEVAEVILLSKIESIDNWITKEEKDKYKFKISDMTRRFND